MPSMRRPVCRCGACRSIVRCSRRQEGRSSSTFPETTMSNQLPRVLITGASTGIGAIYADRFARRGHDLVLVARDEARMRELAARLEQETDVAIDVLKADLTSR